MPNPDDFQEWNAFACKVQDVKDFVPDTIVRSDDLGTELCFRDALEPVTRITDLFLQIPLNRLKELPPSSVQRIDALCDEVKGQYEQILKFSPVSENAHNARLALINHINDLADRVYSSLAVDVTYLCVKEIGFSEKLQTLQTFLTNHAKEADQRINRSIDDYAEKMGEIEQTFNRLVSDVRQAAAEQGVSQQAKYFQEEAEKHLKSAEKWLSYTIGTAVFLIICSVISLIVSYCYQPDKAYTNFQIGLSKLLIFSTIAYFLILSGRTRLAHLHNEVINRHRQNALLTFNAFIEGTDSQEVRDTILTHASTCAFSPQESGFSKGSPAPNLPIATLLPKVVPNSPG